MAKTEATPHPPIQSSPNPPPNGRLAILEVVPVQSHRPGRGQEGLARRYDRTHVVIRVVAS
jgi:hypothetical protein